MIKKIIVITLNILLNNDVTIKYRLRKIRKINFDNFESVVYLTKENTKKTAEGVVMDELGLTKYCCRRHMLGHVDVIHDL